MQKGAMPINSNLDGLMMGDRGRLTDKKNL